MPNSATRLALTAFLLGGSALIAPAQAWSLFGDAAKTQAAAKDAKDANPDTAPAQTLDESIRQAQLLRLAGSYPEAIRHLSQVMMVASDDGRVVSEYGKTLAAMGRAQEALNFLTRAQQLQPGDWTIYSALGVSYDQLGNQKEAAASYERALSLKPGEPSVLSNYALSRMLAKDPEGARKLVARAEIAGAAGDPVIARNIAMIKDMAPQGASDQAYVVNTPTPSPVPHAVAAASPPRAPQAVVAPRPLQQTQQPRIAQNPQVAAPRPLLPQSLAMNTMIEAPPQMPQARDTRVVMQAIPVDPLAGPVVKLHPPAPKAVAHVETPRPQQVAGVVPAKTGNQAEDLQARAEAIAKTLTNKPAAIAAAKTEANKDSAAKPQANAAPQAKPAATSVANGAPRPLQAPAPVKTAETPKPVPAPVKTAAAKAAPLKTADAKPAPAKAAKDTVPALRMSANAY